MVFSRSTGPLDSSVGDQIKVHLSRVSDFSIDDGPSRDIFGFTFGITVVSREESDVMSFLAADYSNIWSIITRHFRTSIQNLSKFSPQNFLKLTFRNAVSQVNYVLGFLTSSVAVEKFQEFDDGGFQVSRPTGVNGADHFLSMILDFDVGDVD